MPISSEDAAKCIIIREISDPNALEISENELEKALERGCDKIIIESKKLSDETSTWISVGEYLISTSILSGISSLVTSTLWPKKFYTHVPLTTLSLLSTIAHHKLWETDPCSNYSAKTLTQKEGTELEPCKLSGCVVLIKRSQSVANRLLLLRTCISILAVAFTAWRIYVNIRATYL